MSWSASFTVTPGMSPEEFEPSTSNVDDVDEHLDQYREAIASAFGIILSGVVGESDKTFKVQLSGHGNPNHEPQAGWSNDTVTVTIYQAPEETS